MYNVVLNSQYSTTETLTNDTVNKNYYIDWSAILPDKNFKLTFSFMSETNTITQLNAIPLITIDFLNQANIVLCQSKYQATSSNILGMVFCTYLNPTSSLAYFRADTNFNNPIYLSRPRQNNFNVRVINNDNPPAFWTDDNPSLFTLGSYVLILSFEECD